ncbi:hypothetical protein DNFV4_00434 [Nitrospira tepida]|uniref:Uncharacterized protein n=1 Tax=Nitrospira tepida TaxID=2973512 RepID=A0AA86MVY3_9BACT|nr:hypothetical protein DNFV4_00434 [Nitrospira tepida]
MTPHFHSVLNTVYSALADGGEWGQVILRHTDLPAYRCFLPDLAGFTGFCCTGPSPYTKFDDEF